MKCRDFDLLLVEAMMAMVAFVSIAVFLMAAIGVDHKH